MNGRCGGWRDFGSIPEAVLAMGMRRGGRWGGGGWGGAWGDWSGDWGGGRGRSRRRVLDASELRLVLLKLIVDQPRHGYDLMRAIEELTGGSYVPSPGVVYPTLTLLQDMGLIEESAASSGARKVFAATGDGTSHAAEKAEEIARLFDRLGGMGEQQRTPGGAPISRAVGNLLSALWHRVGREDADEDRLHEIAAILDEAAQRIERLK